MVEPATQLLLDGEQPCRARGAHGSPRSGGWPREADDGEGARRNEGRRGERSDPRAGRRLGCGHAQDRARGARAHRQREVVHDDGAGSRAGGVPLRTRQRDRRADRVREDACEEGRPRHGREARPPRHDEDGRRRATADAGGGARRAGGRSRAGGASGPHGSGGSPGPGIPQGRAGCSPRSSVRLRPSGNGRPRPTRWMPSGGPRSS